MVRCIRAGEASGIIAWHPDRLARNRTDGGHILDLVDDGQLNQLRFCSFWFENTPQGKANLGHAFVESKQFSDKLAEDTQRGLEEKAQMGHYPSKAQRGYLNHVATKTVVLDPELAPVMKRAFEEYATGTRTIDDIRTLLAEEGLTTRPAAQWNSAGGNRVHSDFVSRFLRNPFYFGHFMYAGQLYEGKHPPIITKKLFDQVQEVLARRCPAKASPNPPKALR